MSTTMGIKAQKLGIDLRGMTVVCAKGNVEGRARAGSLDYHPKFIFPCQRIIRSANYSNKPRLNCPVHKKSAGGH